MKLLTKKTSALVLSTLMMASAYAVDREEGGYAGTTNEGHDQVVYNFLKHFKY